MKFIAALDQRIGLDPEQRIGVVVAAYSFYLLVFFGLGNEVTQLWPEALVVLAATLVSMKLSHEHRGINKLFFAVIAAFFLFDLFNVLLLQFGSPYNLVVFTDSLLDPPDPGVPLNSLFYSLSLFMWICAWSALIVHHSKELREGKVYLLLTPLLIVGSILLMHFQLESFNFQFNQSKARLDFIDLILGIAGVQLCLFCVLMGVRRGLIILIIGFVLGAGNDIIAVFNSIEGQIDAAGGETDILEVLVNNTVYLHALWLAGKAMMLIGLLALPQLDTDDDPDRTVPCRLINPRENHSGLSVYLLLFWMVTVSIGMLAVYFLIERPHFLAMFIVMFSSICVIFMAELTTKFDRAVSYIARYMGLVFDNQLSTDHKPKQRSSTRKWLEVTGLDDVIDEANSSAAGLKKEVIFLGPERLNRPDNITDDSNRTTCFLVMPFSTDWSDGVTHAMRNVCRDLDIWALRGDDIFRPTDILDDIWNGIMQADFVIADITGNNANVFYELGMAHAIGKPVIILAQDDKTVPFDLKTRRILIYDVKDFKKLEDELRDCVIELMKYYDFKSRSELINGNEVIAPPEI